MDPLGHALSGPQTCQEQRLQNGLSNERGLEYIVKLLPLKFLILFIILIREASFGLISGSEMSKKFNFDGI